MNGARQERYECAAPQKCTCIQHRMHIITVWLWADGLWNDEGMEELVKLS